MGRPKKEKYEIEERFTTAAFRLAESYSVLLTDRQYLEDLMSGNFEYTESLNVSSSTVIFFSARISFVRSSGKPYVS